MRARDNSRQPTTKPRDNLTTPVATAARHDGKPTTSNRKQQRRQSGSRSCAVSGRPVPPPPAACPRCPPPQQCSSSATAAATARGRARAIQGQRPHERPSRRRRTRGGDRPARPPAKAAPAAAAGAEEECLSPPPRDRHPGVQLPAHDKGAAHAEKHAQSRRSSTTEPTRQGRRGGAAGWTEAARLMRRVPGQAPAVPRGHEVPEQRPGLVRLQVGEEPPLRRPEPAGAGGGPRFPSFRAQADPRVRAPHACRGSGSRARQLSAFRFLAAFSPGREAHQLENSWFLR